MFLTFRTTVFWTLSDSSIIRLLIRRLFYSQHSGERSVHGRHVERSELCSKNHEKAKTQTGNEQKKQS